MKTVITYGIFDLFHYGHERLLERAKQLGDRLIVGVTTDQYAIERGKLCVVDCAWNLPFGHFMDGLEKLGVDNALYCDMGRGWNYSCYRQDDGSVKELFPTPGKYTTNWIAFYGD